MSRRRSSQSIVANPVLVGAVTTLVVVVAVFLAYNANNGLPFVPTRSLNVQMTGGANLVKGNEVREGGFRVGVIDDMKPVLLKSGAVGAELKLKLDKKVGALPVDTTFVIRPRSALGLKYLQLNKGSSKKTLEDGATLAPTSKSQPVELDNFYNIFDKKTRDASRSNLKGFGNTLAARGASLNQTIESLPRLFGVLAPVMRNLSDPNTHLARFFQELGDAARVVAPVADQNAHLFTDMATTFEAFSRDPEALKATIQKSPSTLDVSTVSLRAQRPFLNDSAAFGHDLRFATRELRAALPDINGALEIGTPVIRRSVGLNKQLQEAMRALRDLATAPTTNGSLRGLTDLVGTLNPTLKYLGPFQTVCDYWNYEWTYLSEHLSEVDPTGTSQRAMANNAGDQENSVGSQGAFEPANGEKVTRGTPQYLHGQAYGAAIDNQGNADCEGGQRGYVKKLAVFAGKDSHGNPFLVGTDPHTPGNQGPTYAGKAKVPAGETFTREPETGPKLPPEQATP